MGFNGPVDYGDLNSIKNELKQIGSKDQFKLRYLVRRVAEDEGVNGIIFVDIDSMCEYLAKFYCEKVLTEFDVNQSEGALQSLLDKDDAEFPHRLDLGVKGSLDDGNKSVWDFKLKDTYSEKSGSLVDFGFDDLSTLRVESILDLGYGIRGGVNKEEHLSREDLFFKFIMDYSAGYSDLSSFDRGELLFVKGRELECTIAWLVVRNFDGGYLYDGLNLPLDLDEYERMYVAILEFFSFLNVDSNFKMELLQSVKDACSRVNDKKDPFEWVDLNDEKCVSWVWSYIKKKSDDTGFGMLSQSVKVMVKSSRLRFLSASFYAWDVDENTKKWFMRELRGAWSQKKFRDRNKDNGRLNTYIGKNAKMALDELVLKENSNASNVLERIILAEYARFKK